MVEGSGLVAGMDLRGRRDLTRGGAAWEGIWPDWGRGNGQGRRAGRSSLLTWGGGGEKTEIWECTWRGRGWSRDLGEGERSGGGEVGGKTALEGFLARQGDVGFGGKNRDGGRGC